MLQAILQRELKTGFASLPGTHIHGRLPISGTLLNQILKEIVAKRDTPVKGVALAILDDNKGVALIAIDMLLLPKQIEVPFSIEPVVGRGDRLLVVVNLEVGGVLGKAIPVVLGAMGSVPGLKSEGSRIELDLGAKIRERNGGAEIAPLFKTLEVRTRRGFADIVFDLQVEEAQ